ncbi:hypothetical protein CsSME_00003943 [Camellia sinensis var. sinensis]
MYIFIDFTLTYTCAHVCMFNFFPSMVVLLSLQIPLMLLLPFFFFW